MLMISLTKEVKITVVQWWLGSSGGSLELTPDCKTAVLGSNPAISPAYSGLPVLRWAAIWDGTSLQAVL
jgi:hypothetical protein